MKWNILFAMLMAAALLAALSPATAEEEPALATPVLTLRWQRLVGDTGGTCERCGATQAEFEQATVSLVAALGALGIEVRAETAELDALAAAADISQSNRIWLNDRPLEDWLGASVGMSDCASCCAELGAEVECRTLTVGTQTYETIPALLIIRAGLLAAADLLAGPPAASGCGECGACPFSAAGCCPSS